MATINSILSELLIEIAGICSATEIKYAVIGKTADSIITDHTIGEEIVEPIVLMSGKDMTKFIDAFEKEERRYRAVEYFGNSNRVTGLATFYCATDTTFIRLNENVDYQVKGMRIRIEPLRVAGKESTNTEAQRVELGLLCQENIVRAFSSKDRIKALMAAKSQQKKARFGDRLFQSLCLTEEEGRTYVLDNFNKLFIEETAIDDAKKCLLDGYEIRCTKTPTLAKEIIDISKELIISSEIPFAEYETKIPKEGIDLDNIRKLQRKSKLWHMITKEDDIAMERAWERVLLSGDRLEMLQLYEDRIKDLIKIRDEGRYEELEEELKVHEEAVLRNLANGLGLLVHPDLSELQYEVFARRGDRELIDMIQKRIPAGHKRAIEWK